ncbi:MAG: DUF503 domain-containing protein [Deltaproteobacteria bacterium]|nr:DUF503 domain-containing protein [Deltaproteobacteria bacterium]
MLIGALTLKFRLHDIRSLKDKRNIANSLKAKLRNSFNVSVAEVGDSDDCDALLLAVVHVSNSKQRVEAQLNKALAMVEAVSSEELTDVSVEVFGA